MKTKDCNYRELFSFTNIDFEINYYICLRFNHSVPLTFVFLKITDIFPLLAISQLLSYYNPSIFDPFIFPQMAKRLIPLHSTSWSVTFTLPCLSQSRSQEELSDKWHSSCISQVLECPSLPHLCLQPWTLPLLLYEVPVPWEVFPI